MQQLLITLKREYWENRAVIVGIPLIIAALALVAAIGVEVVKEKITDSTVSTFIQGATDQELSPDEIRELDEELRDLEDDIDNWSLDFNDTRSDSGIEAMSIFVTFAWLATFYYLLGALYNDRKDKSILFWKSMPVSEHFNVLSKLGFGTLVITAISVLVGWGLAIVLFVFGLGDVGNQGLSAISFYGYFLAPVKAIIVGLFWGAPIFAYLAWASAAARRSPFLLVIVPILALSFLEGVVFENVEILSFFFSHMPFKVLAHLDPSASSGTFYVFFVEEARQMLIGLIVAAVFTAAAIWYRNNKFEI